jgi:anti-sigma factor RsiW
MKVTRDVIYDLLPAYFAGDVSDDTRALVEEYFESDPEFGRMAARFKTLVGERQRKPSGEADEIEREREAFQAARDAAELPQRTRAAALVWGFASLFSLGIALLTWSERLAYRNPGIILGLLFGAMAVAIFALSFRITPHSSWRPWLGLDEATLDTSGLGRRKRRRLDV